jgi:NosR/NirI family transcriptional regulator, nitrous oxide reductase regulator
MRQSSESRYNLVQHMKSPVLAVVVGSLVAGAALVAVAQTPLDAKLNGQLQRLFPSASTFSPKQGSPPHIKAFGGDARTIIGLAFWTTELEPLERGYDGPIKILVGLDPKGILAGIVVADHHEPYGYFSVDLPEFAAQFAGKDIRDPFRIGGDVDAISRASITVGSASRAVRNSARRIARQLLTPPESAK